MEIKNFYGDVLSSTAELVCHGCNAKGVFNSGVAKAVRNKYPEVYAKYEDAYNKGLIKTGSIQVVDVSDDFDGKKIVNCITQENYGYDGAKYTSYDALDTCMQKLRKYCEEHYIKSIAIPWHMCSDRGGGNWEIVTTIICEAFKDSNITIEVWKL